MQTRLSRSTSSRMRPDLESAIEYLPGLASLALWCRFADTHEDVIAYTDGNTIYAGADYENFDPMLLNIAADAIINKSLENLTGLETPANAWTLEKLWEVLEKTDKEKVTVNFGPTYHSFGAASQNRKIANLTKAELTNVGRWSCEELYYFIKTQAKARTEFLKIISEAYEEDSLGGDLSKRSKLEKRHNEYGKLINADNCGSAADALEEKREWGQRLSLLRGTMPEVFQRLAGELPRVETPWEQILRFIVQTTFQESTKVNYSRPSRRWLSLERDYKLVAGVGLPFSPDVTKKRGTRLAVALDTSGSIGESLLSRFLAEIAALCTFNQRNLVLIIGDAKVHKIAEIDWRDAERELSQIEYTGGGGTDFRPIIEAASEYEPDALIYLTDLFGETGDEPDFPVIWATHGVSGEATWGEQIKLK